MEAFADLPPSEKHYCNECRLHEKGKYAFNCKRGTEYVSDQGDVATLPEEVPDL